MTDWKAVADDIARRKLLEACTAERDLLEQAQKVRGREVLERLRQACSMIETEFNSYVALESDELHLSDTAYDSFLVSKTGYSLRFSVDANRLEVRIAKDLDTNPGSNHSTSGKTAICLWKMHIAS